MAEEEDLRGWVHMCVQARCSPECTESRCDFVCSCAQSGVACLPARAQSHHTLRGGEEEGTCPGSCESLWVF